MSKENPISVRFEMRSSGAESVYACFIEGVVIRSPGVKIHVGKGEHLSGKSRKDVTAVVFLESKIHYFPAGLRRNFPSVVAIDMSGVGLRTLSRKDFDGLEAVTSLYFMCNDLQHLPGDLFSGLKCLTEVSFSKNEIKSVGADLLSGLEHQLKFISFADNDYIDYIYSEKEFGVFGSFEELQDCIISNCRVAQCAVVKRKAVKKEIVNKVPELPEPRNEKFKDLEKLMQSKRLSDVKVIVGDKTFELHKFVLGARSPTFAEIFESNQESNEVELHNISQSTFRAIIDFIYEDLPPDDSVDLVQLFATAGKFKIFKLMEILEEKLASRISKENVHKVLAVAELFKSRILKTQSQTVLQKMYPDVKEIEQLVDRPDVVREIIIAKKEYDERLSKISHELNCNKALLNKLC